MSVGYSPILWNRQKKIYDRYLWLGISMFLVSYVAFQYMLRPTITPETLIIRASGLSAFVLLHFILAIGPLSRISTRFLPLLYNRRHAGVSMFLLAVIHGIFNIIQFHTLGDTNALVSIFTANEHYNSVNEFPFQVLGFFALIIFFLMAATSHDFWLKNLGPVIWKALHMGVYVAYTLVILHVALGALQYESHPVNWITLLLGFVSISGLHMYAGWMEHRQSTADKDLIKSKGWVEVCAVDDIQEKYARTIFIEGENIAVFKYDGKISAIHNECKHQMGPLGEGKIVDGCVTCPWHGYQYHPENGRSPAPFTEKVGTYHTKIRQGKVWVNPVSKEEGTFVDPASIQPS